MLKIKAVTEYTELSFLAQHTYFSCNFGDYKICGDVYTSVAHFYFVDPHSAAAPASLSYWFLINLWEVLKIIVQYITISCTLVIFELVYFNFCYSGHFYRSHWCNCSCTFVLQKVSSFNCSITANGTLITSCTYWCGLYAPLNQILFHWVTTGGMLPLRCLLLESIPNEIVLVC